MHTDVAWLPAADLARAVAAGQLDRQEVVAHHLEAPEAQLLHHLGVVA